MQRIEAIGFEEDFSTIQDLRGVILRFDIFSKSFILSVNIPTLRSIACAAIIASLIRIFELWLSSSAFNMVPCPTGS